MKTTAVLLAGGLAAMVIAQGQDLAECTRGCLNRMLAKGDDLQCDVQLEGNSLLQCLCKNQNYAYGIYDCTVQSCTNDIAILEVQKAIQIASTQCQSAGIQWTYVPGSGTPEANPEISGSATGAKGNAPQTGSSAAPSVTGGVETSAVGEISTVITTNVPAETGAATSVTDDHANTGVETTQTAGGSDTPEPSGEASATTTDDDGDNSAAVCAAAPAAGVLIAAGVAAFLL